MGVIDIAGLGCRLLFCYLLCSCPPDIRATDPEGKTAVEIARHWGHSDIVEFLNTYQPQPKGEPATLSVSCVDYVYRRLDQVSYGPAHP